MRMINISGTDPSINDIKRRWFIFNDFSELVGFLVELLSDGVAALCICI